MSNKLKDLVDQGGENVGLILGIVAHSVREQVDASEALNQVLDLIDSLSGEDGMNPVLDSLIGLLPLIPYKIIKKTVIHLAMDDEDKKTLESPEAEQWFKKFQLAIRESYKDEPEEPAVGGETKVG